MKRERATKVQVRVVPKPAFLVASAANAACENGPFEWGRYGCM